MGREGKSGRGDGGSGTQRNAGNLATLRNPVCFPLGHYNRVDTARALTDDVESDVVVDGGRLAEVHAADVRAAVEALDAGHAK